MKSLIRSIGLVVLASLAVSRAAHAEDRVRLGLFTAKPVMWDLETNWRTFEQTVERYAGEKPDIVVTPEAWLDGYAAAAGLYNSDKFDQSRFDQVAQDENTSPYIAKVRALAAKHQLSVLFGFTEKKGGKYYNTALLIDKSGRTVGRYRKTHLVDADIRAFTRGDDIPVFDTAWGKLGALICADRRWPETARVLRLKGRDLR